jgi:hypothetical protein
LVFYAAAFVKKANLQRKIIGATFRSGPASTIRTGIQWDFLPRSGALLPNAGVSAPSPAHSVRFTSQHFRARAGDSSGHAVKSALRTGENARAHAKTLRFVPIHWILSNVR